MCVCMYVCMCMYIYIYIYIRIRTHGCTNNLVNVQECMYVCMHIYIYASAMYVVRSIYLRMNVELYMSMHMFT